MPVDDDDDDDDDEYLLSNGEANTPNGILLLLEILWAVSAMNMDFKHLLFN